MHIKSHVIDCQINFDPKYKIELRNEDGEDTERLWSQYDIGGNIALMTLGNRRDYISSMTHFIATKAYYNIARRLKKDFETAYRQACIGVELIIGSTLDYDLIKSQLELAKKNILKRYSQGQLRESDCNEEACVDIAREIFNLTNTMYRYNGTRATTLIASNLNTLRNKLNKSVNEFNERFPLRPISAELMYAKAKEGPLLNVNLMESVALLKALGQIKATLQAFDTAINTVESYLKKDLKSLFHLAGRKRDLILLEELKSFKIDVTDAVFSHPKISRYYRSIYDKL